MKRGVFIVLLIMLVCIYAKAIVFESNGYVIEIIKINPQFSSKITDEPHDIQVEGKYNFLSTCNCFKLVYTLEYISSTQDDAVYDITQRIPMEINGSYGFVNDFAPTRI